MSRGLVPTARIAPLLRAWLAEDEQRTNRQLALVTGVPERRLYAILSGEQTTIQFDTADRLLCGLDAVEEWHLSFADLYRQPLPTAKHSRSTAAGGGRAGRPAAPLTPLDRLRAIRLQAIAAGRLPA